uniref:Uncharacterized protein n=1 Tax=Pseudomonas phage HRDY3 TaxID=3236930 RepID=A0AB39CE86_9VIRU
MPDPFVIVYCAEISDALAKIPEEDWPSHVDDPEHRLYGHPMFLLTVSQTQHIGISNKPNPDWIKSHKLMLRYGLVEPRSYGATNERRTEEKEEKEKGVDEI